MPRPRKWRVVEFVPDELYFIPFGKPRCELDEEILKVEEIEAVRLKDAVNMDQDECAEKMQVSRQTFQRILAEARTKIARALIEGKALKVSGGDFTRHVCRIFCSNCQNNWDERYENFTASGTSGYSCPKCGSKNITCCGREKRFCTNQCHKK
ncbi:MAG: DUF134 domain-containing protein [Eubacteriales bacterium]